MGLPSLKDKLALELKRGIKEESQVVYILSRVRKILELEKKEKEYKIIKLYCDWAFHSEIENVEPIKKLLEGVMSEDDTAKINFILFVPFHEQFKIFLSEYNLPMNIYKTNLETAMFNKFLSQIYSDTPLIIKEVKKKKVRWVDNTDPSSIGPSHSGSFKVDD